MAGDWIKMRTDLAEDPAVIGMAASLDLDEDTVVGKLHKFWSWLDRQSRDGHARGVTRAWLDRYVGRVGFADALVAVGWLLVDPEGITIPHHERHNGKTAKERALGGKRQAKSRAASVTGVTQSPLQTSRTERDKNVTREEKRREEPEARAELLASPEPPVARKPEGGREEVPVGAQPEQTPAGVNPEAWRLWKSHRCAKRAWSTAVEFVATGHCRALIEQGVDVDAVLIWATTRNLADLLDAARRMAADAEKEHADAQRRRPGEGPADAARRNIVANGSHLDEREHGHALIPL